MSEWRKFREELLQDPDVREAHIADREFIRAALAATKEKKNRLRFAGGLLMMLGGAK